MKHAFLIMAHNNFSVVKSLLRQLDDEKFDIYIHINAKVKDFPKDELEHCVNKSRLCFVPRKKIGYCDYSMVEGVKSLFSTATAEYHDYYHLISGADLLIKTKTEFCDFFAENKGMEFVGFKDSFLSDTVEYRNYFIALGRQKSVFGSKVFIKIRKMLIEVQKKLNSKVKMEFEVQKGCDWYSISHKAALYLLEQESKFKKSFFRAYCPTEFFSQTILWNSPFRKNLYQNDSDDENVECLREIDWKRGMPYIYRMEDKDILLNSKGMFARKFDENTDMEIVKFLEGYVKGKK